MIPTRVKQLARPYQGNSSGYAAASFQPSSPTALAPSPSKIQQITFQPTTLHQQKRNTPTISSIGFSTLVLEPNFYGVKHGD